MTPPASAQTREIRLLPAALTATGLVLLALVTLTPNSATRILAWPWWAGWRVLLAIPPLLLAIDALFGRRAPADTGPGPGSANAGTPAALSPLFAACLFAGAAIEVAAAAASAHPHTSFDAAFTAVSAACAVPLLARRREGERAALAGILGLAGIAFALVSLGSWLLDVVVPGVRRLAELNRAAGTNAFPFVPDAFRNERPLGHSNYTAGLALLALPWLVALACRARGGARAGWTGGALLVGAALLTSQSRGAIIGLGAGAVFAVFLVTRVARGSPRTTVALVCGALALLAALALAIPRVRQPLFDLFAGRGPNIGDQQRLAMLRVGVAMGAGRWWIGQGPGLTARLYPAYRHTVDGGVDSALQLHSTPVQLWADTGAPGVAVATVLALLALASAARRVRDSSHDGGPEERLVAGAAGVSLAGYAAFAFTDYQLDLPIFAAWIAADLAVVGAARANHESFLRMRAWLASLGALGLIGLAMVTIPEWRARSIFAAAVSDLESGGDAAAFDEQVVRAATLLPDDPHMLAGGAAAHLRLGYAATDAGARGRHLATARALLEQALTREPDLEFAHFNLGWLLLAGDPARAAAHFRAAQHLVPDRGGVYLGLALARFGTDDVARGVDALALEILNDPIVVTAPAWDAPTLAPHHEAAARRALALAGEWKARSPSPALERTCELLTWWLGGDAGAGLAENATLAAAATTPGERRELLARFFFVHTQARASAAELDALEHLAVMHGADARAWLRAPEGRDAPFVNTLRRERTAYAMLAGNMDIPVPLDAYFVQENRIATVFFDFVFPPRGHLPDSLLVEYVARRDL